MERITQLNSSEYEELVEKANINEKLIEKKAEELWKKKGSYRIEVELSFRNQYNNDYPNYESMIFAPSTDIDDDWDIKIMQILMQQKI